MRWPRRFFSLKILFLLALAGTAAYAEPELVEEIRPALQHLNQSTKSETCASCQTHDANHFDTIPPADLKDVFGEKLKVSVVSMKRAEELFLAMKKQKKIPFGFAQDGCYARAHEMARLLEKRGVITGKIFSVGKLKVQIQPNQLIEWAWHVAPMLAVRNAGKDELYVIDPSLFSKPVTVKEWLVIQEASPEAKVKEVHYTKRFVYMYREHFERRDKFSREDLAKAKETLETYSIFESMKDWTATQPAPVPFLPTEGAPK